MTRRNIFYLGFVSSLILLAGCQKTAIDVKSPEKDAAVEETSGKLVSATKTSTIGVNEAVLAAADNFGKLVPQAEGYQAEITELLKGPFSGIQWQVETYRIKYHTVDANFHDKILSADIGFVNDASGCTTRRLNTVSLFHCQFNVNDGLTMMFKDIVIPVRAMHNALVVYPHYQGVGEDKGTPGTYIPISESLLKARQAIDAELAALEFIGTLNNVSMACGYYTENMGISNGGSTALATQYLLENDAMYSAKNESVNLRTTCVGEGCYNYNDLILSMFRETEVEASEIVAKLMPLAFVSFINSVHKTWGKKYFGPALRLESYFSDAFNKAKVEINGKEMGILKAMDSGDFPVDFSEESVFEKNGLLTIRSMINPDLYDEDGNLREDSPHIQALKKAFDENQLRYGWNPDSPLLIEHSAKDDMLPYADALEAYRALGNNGKNENVAMKTLPLGDHLTASMIYLLEMLVLPHPVPLN